MKSGSGKAPDRPQPSRSAGSSSSTSSDKSRSSSSKTPTQQTRPPLVTRRSRSPTGNSSPSNVSRPADHGGGGSSSSSSSRRSELPQHDGTLPSGESRVTASPANSAELERLKAAVKTAQGRQNLKQWTSTPPETSPTAAAHQTGHATATIVSSSLLGDMDSPASGSHPNSTDSTDSGRTVRGVATPGPVNPVAQTPSYPFPRVQRAGGSQKQTPPRLSSSIPQSPRSDNNGEGDVTPARLTSPLTQSGRPTFVPPSAVREGVGDGDAEFPEPNLYDLVLRINSEIGLLESWWAQLTQIVREWYMVDRMTLALPIDATDIHDVPWGLKASFNVVGLKEAVRERQSDSSGGGKPPHSRATSLSQRPAAQTAPARAAEPKRRPPIESRHSFAGYEVGASERRKESSKAPAPSKRPGLTRRRTERIPQGVQETSVEPESFTSPSEHALNSPESVQDSSLKPASSFPEKSISAVFPELISLDRESEHLLDSNVASELLARNSVMVMTRNYSGSRRSDAENVENSTKLSSTVAYQSAEYKSRLKYEEVEQMPPSPWSQSPAPSPAIQDDPDENPFFSPGTLNEDTFTTTPTSEQRGQYSQYGPGAERIRAIGIENSLTVIHVPLVLPGPFQEALTPLARVLAGGQQAPRQDTLMSTKEPVAILSISSTHVPYPQNLLQSLKLLAPHLATSFSNSYQSSLLQERFHGALQLQGGQARAVNFATDKGQGLGLGLEKLLQHDLEDASSSTTASILSPSEYSSHSRPSPGSMVATPGFEPLENYFETTQSAGVQAHAKNPDAPASSTTSPPPQRSSAASSTKPQGSDTLKPEEAASRRHSLLHSHGADFSASFQSLHAAALPKPPNAQAPLSRSASGRIATGTFLPPSERLLRTMIDSLPVQIFTASPGSGEVTWVNSKLLVYRGGPSAEVSGDLWEALHEDDVQVCVDAWKQALGTGQQYQQKARIRRFDGAYRWFYVRAVPLKDKHYNIVHWIGTAIDIDDQHAAETQAARQQETAASEAKWKNVANSSPQIVFAATRSKGITFCNLRWAEYSGQTEQEAMGAGFLDCVFPEDVIKCKLPVFDEYGAGNVPVSMPAEPRRAPSSSSGDLTLEHLAKDSPIVTSSPDAHRLPQRKLSQLASTGILRLSKDPDGRASYSTEVRLRMKSGAYRWHLVRVVPEEPVNVSDELTAMWYGTATDINDHKELEETLKETMEAKSRFLSNMSHEIRTPLNGISGMANLLIDSGLTPEQLDQVSVIRASTEGLRDLINDILDLSKVEAGMVTLNMDWFHVRFVIEDVNDLTSSLAIGKGLELNYMVERDVPTRVKGDRFRFRQVLLNIIGNAIKFTQAGEVFVHCQVAPEEDVMDGPLEADTIMLKINISDTGPGFTDKDAERLFKRFSQIDGSSTRQHGGSGLGLVISHELAELHGGSMSATSQPGHGSTFSFTMRFGVSTNEQSPVASFGEHVPRSIPDDVVQSPGGSIDPSSLTEAGVRILPLPSQPKPVSPLGVTSFSILVVCPYPWTLKATVHHIERVLTRDIPFQIATCRSVAECQGLLLPQAPLTFTHIVLVVRELEALTELIEQVVLQPLSAAALVVICDVTLKRALVERLSSRNVSQPDKEARLQFIFKPLKPSKLGAVFDPAKSRSHSRDQNQDQTQRIVSTQKQMLDRATSDIGNRGFRVLLVEDNKINQMVMLKLLDRISVGVDKANDGVECTELVFQKPPGYYSLVLCDLHMPRKDGYQTCKDIRQWERESHGGHLPIIALSANVLGDVYAKCIEAGFDSYLTKPIEFQQLCDVLKEFLDPIVSLRSAATPGPSASPPSS